ncbi:hypothetical protein [Swaminathania salitolerans]|nr:hypothetical protein [Swaminathania salitolerans]
MPGFVAVLERTGLHGRKIATHSFHPAPVLHLAESRRAPDLRPPRETLSDIHAI